MSIPRSSSAAAKSPLILMPALVPAELTSTASQVIFRNSLAANCDLPLFLRQTKRTDGLWLTAYLPDKNIGVHRRFHGSTRVSGSRTAKPGIGQ